MCFVWGIGQKLILTICVNLALMHQRENPSISLSDSIHPHYVYTICQCQQHQNLNPFKERFFFQKQIFNDKDDVHDISAVCFYLCAHTPLVGRLIYCISNGTKWMHLSLSPSLRVSGRMINWWFGSMLGNCHFIDSVFHDSTQNAYDIGFRFCRDECGACFE